MGMGESKKGPATPCGILGPSQHLLGNTRIQVAGDEAETSGGFMH